MTGGLEFYFHEDIGADEWRWVRRNVLEAYGFIEVNCAPQLVTGLEAQAFDAKFLGFLDGEQEEFAADAAALPVFRDGHLHELETAIVLRREGTRANHFRSCAGYEDRSTRTDDFAQRIGEHNAVGFFQGEELRDPVLVELAESFGIVALKVSDANFRRHGGRHLLRKYVEHI